MARVSVQVIGARAVQAKLDKMGPFAVKETAKELVRFGETVIGDAKEITPVDTGNLRASGHVQKPEFTDRGPRVNIGFGGPAGGGGTNVSGGTNTEDVGYALVVHENPRGVHFTVGEERFLEKALQKHSPEVAKEFRRQLDLAIEREFGTR